jgi:Cu2+-exporting ATPase
VSALPSAIKTRATTRCAHCSLTVPASLVALEGPSFCCAGCKAVWHTLHACGLERYYELAARATSEREAGGRRPATVTNRRYAHFDRPEFLEKHALACGESNRSIELVIDGLRCGACVWLLEALPRLVSGLLVVRVDLGGHTVRIEWDPARTSLAEVARHCDQLGYQLLPARDRSARERDRAGDRAWQVRSGGAAMQA